VSPSVRFEEEADDEYRAAARWYEKRQAGLGIEFLEAVDATLDQIVRFPRTGAPVPRAPTDLPIRRMSVDRFPYHVVYLQTESKIRGLAVAHDRRRPGYWKDRV